MANGARKPPILPSELITAMPPAAALPLRNNSGMAQAGPRLAKAEAVERLISTSLRGPEVSRASSRAMAARAIGSAMYGRLSAWRSATRPTRDIATTARP